MTRSALPSLRSLGGKIRERFGPEYLVVERRRKRSRLPFRFIDLPIELEEIIYSHYAAVVEDEYEAGIQNAHEAARSSHGPNSHVGNHLLSRRSSDSSASSTSSTPSNGTSHTRSSDGRESYDGHNEKDVGNIDVAESQHRRFLARLKIPPLA